MMYNITATIYMSIGLSQKSEAHGGMESKRNMCKYLNTDGERLNVATAAIIYESRSETLHIHVKTHAASVGVTCWMHLRCLCFHLVNKQSQC